MNDCFWCSIRICEEMCGCDQYLSMNSVEGRKLIAEWDGMISEILLPLAVDFAKGNGWKEPK